MARTKSSCRFISATWSTFQTSLGLGPIPTSRTAGTALATALVDARLVDASECILRSNPEVVDFIDIVELEAAEAEETLIVYLCSHGLFPFTTPFRLATSRTKRPDDTGRSLIVSEILSIVSRAPARNKALIVDSCFSGNAASSLSDQMLNFSIGPPPECTVIAAASPLAQADAGDPLALAPVFTEQLVRTLYELREKPSSVITLGNLFNMTGDKLRALDAPSPRLFTTNQGADTKLSREGNGDSALLVSTRPAPSVRVLYVDDGPEWCNTFDKAVASPGILVDLATDSDAARSLLALQHYDLIVLDLFLADDTPATDLIELLAKDVSDVPVFLTTRLGKGGATSWSQLSAVFKYPSGVSAVYFKHKGEHSAAAREHLADLLSKRTSVLQLVTGASDAAAQAASRAAVRLPRGVGQDARREHLAELEIEALTLLHECLEPWLGDAKSRYIDSFTLTPLGGGRSSCTVFAGAPCLGSFENPPVSQLVLKIGPRSEIQEEVTRYDRYVQVGIPLSIRTDKIRQVYGTNLGIVLYSLLGEDSGSVEELGDAPQEVIYEAIGRVMSPVSRRWYASSSTRASHFLAYYESQHFGYSRFEKALDDCNSYLAGLKIPSGRTKPTLRKSLLDSSRMGGPTPAVLVHGDMHLGNLVHYGASKCAIIDYRNVGIGPRLIDFATLEIDCWIRGITPELPKSDLYLAFADACTTVSAVAAAMPRTPRLDDLDEILLAFQGELESLPEWLSLRMRAILLCRRAAYATFGDDVGDEEYAAQLWLASVRRWSYKSAWASADERRALGSAPVAIAVVCDQMLTDD